MTSNFEASESNSQSVANSNVERDRFELLSAYLDGEVTAAERRQVQEWLDNDRQTQRLYTRLLRLRQGLQNLPLPKEQQSPQQLSEQVFQRIDRHQRLRRALVWGGGAIAALFIGAVSGLLPGTDIFSPLTQFASQESPPDADSLMIALNHPVIDIPPAAIPSSPNAVGEPYGGPNVVLIRFGGGTRRRESIDPTRSSSKPWSGPT